MFKNKTQRSAISENASSLIASQPRQDFSNNKKATPVDSQVKPRKKYATRRLFDAAYKTRILAAYDACSDAASRGALLRREGLYYARIMAWRQQQANGKINATKGKKNAVRMDHLTRENEQLKKKM